MVKTSKNLLLQNQKSYDLKIWHVASGLKLYKVLINEDPGLTSADFTTRSNKVTYTFEWGKLLQSHFQTSSPLKPHGQSKPYIMLSLLGKGEQKSI